ncbi:hypothetical protein [Qipengyuania marisflavi]|uniref:Uncharacterized protein n=1 Tax=Qipengyuania marisflavi TaxID=2486356 RepID=A0A5S3P5N1_9SPHN|nr:hypothetical protein [Qipengyuania marisflavi]TMM48349.1 hypothetical protein FEV51_08710 [Qipengyuania marisflavi]
MTTATTKPPISSHPAFKYLVALWFALLLGGGLFVMPAEVHNAISTRLGLGSVLPAAAPPLGLTGRAAISALAALLGFVLGLVIALRIAALNEGAVESDSDTEWDADEADAPAWSSEEVETADDATPAEPEATTAPHRILNAREDIGEEGIAAPLPPEPYDEFTEIEEPAEPAFEDGDCSGDALLEAWREENEQDEVEPDELPEPEPAAEEPDIVLAPPPPLDEPTEDSAPDTPLEDQAEPVIEQALGDLSLADLTDRLGRALAHHREQGDWPAEVTAKPHGERGDEVVTCLHPEMPADTPEDSGQPDADSQAILRSALDRLSQTGKPR